MLKLHNAPANDDATIRIIKLLELAGETPEHSEFLADQGLAIAIGIFRGLDKQVEEAVKSEQDRTLVQLVVLTALSETSEYCIAASAIQSIGEVIKKFTDRSS